jgi:hypothetical protein
MIEYWKGLNSLGYATIRPMRTMPNPIYFGDGPRPMANFSPTSHASGRRSEHHHVCCSGFRPPVVSHTAPLSFSTSPIALELSLPPLCSSFLLHLSSPPHYHSQGHVCVPSLRRPEPPPLPQAKCTTGREENQILALLRLQRSPSPVLGYAGHPPASPTLPRASSQWGAPSRLHRWPPRPTERPLSGVLPLPVTTTMEHLLRRVPLLLAAPNGVTTWQSHSTASSPTVVHRRSPESHRRHHPVAMDPPRLFFEWATSPWLSRPFEWASQRWPVGTVNFATYPFDLFKSFQFSSKLPKFILISNESRKLPN